MSYGSDEVAADFTEALLGLNLNSRWEISNLTVIAKENTEHALAISEALKTHIKQTSPSKKLPAFYVLDSIVKNVGTPYTLFFGRQMYNTFMDAYASMDNNMRRKMDEMLKTWKEPVPGSIDTRPVFPTEVTRPIENALIKVRTSAIQAHQEQIRSQQQLMNRGRVAPVSTQYRETPTPPNTSRQPFHPPSAHGSGYASQQFPLAANGNQYAGQANGYPQHSLPQRPPPSQYPPEQAAPSSWQQQGRGYVAADASVDTLNSDIANLITASKAAFAQNPWDSSIQTRLKALLDLQTILASQRLPPDQIAAIKDRVAQLSEAAEPAPRIQTPQAYIPPTPVAAPPTPTPTQQPSLSSLLGPSALAALLARQSATPQVPTPPPASAVPVRSPPLNIVQNQYQQPPTPSSTSTPVVDPNSLLERLRAAGMLPGAPASNTPTLNSLPGGFPPGFPPSPFASTPPNPTRTPLADIPNDVVLKPASLKIPRPHLISSLYERLGAPCTQCGRRFQSDEEGRKKKTAHMDWHFRVHQRMAEAEKRGQHRSWYVDELDWIKSRESDEDQNNAATENGTADANSVAASKPKIQYLPVPDDPALANSICPICQEKFEMKWLDDAQEFVWMDAKKIGERIYHASCYAEAYKDGNASQVKRVTPEPILGKRKADDELVALRAKIKTGS